MRVINRLINNNVKIIGDLSYTIIASLIFYAVTQLIVYPIINWQMGASFLGNVVYFVSVVTIIGQPIGLSFCANRLRLKQHINANNGDYLLVLSYFIAFAVAVAASISSLALPIPGVILFVLYVVTYILRLYATLEFRLTLNFKGLLIQTVILVGGYLLGLLLFFITGIWELIFLVGETSAILYVVLRGSIFKYEKRTGLYNSIITKSVFMLMLSYLVDVVIVNSDKIIIRNMLDSFTVSVFLVVSMIGKALAMLVGPINNVTVSHLAVNNTRVTRTMFFKSLGLYCIFGGVFYIFCIVATPLYVRLFYPDLLQHIGSLNLIVNAGQIISFVSSLLLMIMFVPLGPRSNMILQLVFISIYLPLALFMTKNSGVEGFAYAFLGAGIFRLVLVTVISVWKLPKFEAVS
jgi:hypothetical protein